MALNDIYLGLLGSETLLPAGSRTLSIKEIELGREKRAYDGTLRKDIRAVKHEITLEYEYMVHADYIIMQGIRDLQEELSLKITTLTEERTFTVFIDPISITRAIAVRAGLWRNMTIVLKEV